MISALLLPSEPPVRKACHRETVPCRGKMAHPVSTGSPVDGKPQSADGKQSERDTDDNAPLTRSLILNVSTNPRPVLPSAITATKPVSHTSRIDSVTPILSRPILKPSETTGDALRNLQLSDTSTTHDSPSLLSRATKAVVDKLGFNLESSLAIQNQLEKPTYWTDHVHQKALLKIWDATLETLRSNDGPSVAAELGRTEKRMLEEFAELGQGEKILKRDWVVYVLAESKRRPFINDQALGRGKVLGVGGGTRGNWGPF